MDGKNIKVVETMKGNFTHWLPLITRCPFSRVLLDIGYVRVYINNPVFVEIFQARKIIKRNNYRTILMEHLLQEIKQDIIKENNISWDDITISYKMLFNLVNIQM